MKWLALAAIALMLAGCGGKRWEMYNDSPWRLPKPRIIYVQGGPSI